jgi:Tol biopolymer transport system component
MSKLTDDLLHRTLAARAEGEHTPGELVGDVLAAVESVPQRHGLSLRLAPLRTAMPVLLVAALLLSGLVGWIILASGRVPAPLKAEGKIAFVSATYRWVPGEGLWASDPGISTIASGDDATLVADLPGWRADLFLMGTSDSSNRVSSTPHWSPDGTRIAFRVYNDAPGIYVMNADGSGLTRVTDLPEVEVTNPSEQQLPWPDGDLEWSPDGTEIAFAHQSKLGQPSSLYVVDTNDRQIRLLADRGAAADVPANYLGHGWLDANSFAWSPDGSRIAFVQADDRQTTGLFVINRDGTGLNRLAGADLRDAPDYGYWLAGLTWSPDGSRIAFVRSPWGVRGVYVINADGTDLRVVGGGWRGPEGPTEQLEWSPDGKLIAGLRNQSGGMEIFLTAVNGSGPRSVATADQRLLTEGDAFDWSPDGSQLVFSDLGPNTTTQIYIINTDGTGLQTLAEGEFPSWSAAGR